MADQGPLAPRYEVLSTIASGGMGTVFLGRARGAVGFSRAVAIKRPHPFVTADAALKRQLEHEARVASMIQHPNVVSVLDVAELEGDLVLVMDYVEGCTLKDLREYASAAAVPFDRVAVRVVLDVAAGLHAAHRLRDPTGTALGIVHRDVSPHNVLVGLDGIARLTDFGIAKIANTDANVTASGVMKGKLAYWPPEYVHARQFDARSDLFSLGVVAWEALAGRRLFGGVTTVETLLNVVEGRAPALTAIRPELEPLSAIIAAALAPDPAARPLSVEDFASELERCARGCDAVASQAEVREMVEKAAGGLIDERRRTLAAALPRGFVGASLDASPPSTARDAMMTASLAPTPPTSSPTATRVDLAPPVPTASALPAASPTDTAPALAVNSLTAVTAKEARFRHADPPLSSPTPPTPRRSLSKILVVVSASMVLAALSAFLLRQPLVASMRPSVAATRAAGDSPEGALAASSASARAGESPSPDAPTVTPTSPGTASALAATAASPTGDKGDKGRPPSPSPRPGRAPGPAALLPRHAPPNPYAK